MAREPFSWACAIAASNKAFATPAALPRASVCDKHLAQRQIAIADVLEADSADDFAIAFRHPELSRPRLIECGDFGQIRLVFQA